jgi:hypothetical protein
MREGRERLVLRGESRAQVHDVEPRPGRELEREIERVSGH